MKVCVSSTGPGLDSQVDPRFGRCPAFVIADSESLEFESIKNEAAQAMGGAGISAAQNVASKGVEAVITGNVGPNAYATLSAAGLDILVGASGTVKQAIDMFNEGQLQNAGQATASAHAGVGGAGMVRGMGRGMGAGMGRRMQPGMGSGMGAGVGTPQPTPQTPSNKEEEIEQLENYLKSLQTQIEQIKGRLNELKE